MTHKHLYYSLIGLLVFILLLGCFIACYPKGESDAKKFKKEYEQYNSESKIKVELDNNNPFVYRNEKQIEKILKNNTGIIFIGNAKNETSRATVNLLAKLAKKTDVTKIFYLDNTNITSKTIKKYTDNKVAIIFVIAGEVIAEYSEQTLKKQSIMGRCIECEIEFYMQQTFSDYCDETCND